MKFVEAAVVQTGDRCNEWRTGSEWKIWIKSRIEIQMMKTCGQDTVDVPTNRFESEHKAVEKDGEDEQEEWRQASTP